MSVVARWRQAMALSAVILAAACASPGGSSTDVGASDTDAASEVASTDGSGVDGVHGAGSGCDYIGGWPCNPDKESLVDPGWQGACPGGVGCACGGDEFFLAWSDSDECSSGRCYGQPKGGFCPPAPGEPVPRFKGVDQFGQEVDLYDFAGHGKIIALDMSTGWCTPCKELAQWFIDGDPIVKENSWWEETWDPVRDLVNDGQILWVTVLYEDENGEEATPELVKWWYEQWPHEPIAVLEDADRLFHTWLRPTGLPCLNLIGPDMTMLTYTDRGIKEAFDKLVELHAAGAL